MDLVAVAEPEHAGRAELPRRRLAALRSFGVWEAAGCARSEPEVFTGLSGSYGGNYGPPDGPGNFCFSPSSFGTLSSAYAFQ